MISRMLGSEIHIRDFNGIIATINNFRTRNKVANDLPHSESCTNDYSQVNTGYPHVGEGRGGRTSSLMSESKKSPEIEIDNPHKVELVHIMCAVIIKISASNS